MPIVILALNAGLGIGQQGVHTTLLATQVDAHVRDPKELLQDPTIRAAFDEIRLNEAEEIETQIAICEIAAPEFKEQARANYILKLFQQANLENARIDAAGNVIGERPGKSAHPHLAVAAHLDTVFPEGTNVQVTREGTILKGSGIYDDCRGLIVLVSIARALDNAHVMTGGSITFVADVGEEGTGDLRGVRELFSKTMPGQIDLFVSIDGPGTMQDVTNQGVGSYRYRLTYTGPGGHSFLNFGNANPIHALGRAIALISEFQVPDSPKTTFNVGRIGGGTSVNSIAASAFAEIDMRSEAMKPLEEEAKAFEHAAQSALDQENNRWHGRGKLQMQIDRLGFRPTGETSATSRLVTAVAALNRAMDLPAIRLNAASTDSNLPMSLGIPAITIAGGGVGTGPHTPAEAMDVTGAWIGMQRDLLLVVSLVD